MKILPSSYLPPISYISALLSAPQSCTIDVGEHYVKRTLRNRTRIMSAQGVMDLTIPVKGANRRCQPMRTMQIDNSRRWQHQHWMAILSAYKSSPYFDHYAPYLEPLYRREFTGLVEFNEALMDVIFKLLRLDASLRPPLCESYVEPCDDHIDLRAKGALPSSDFEVREYIQVFSDREPFAADLSILDLLFCEGTTSLEYVLASRR